MTEKHKRIINNTLLPLNAIVILNGDPVDLSLYTAKFLMEDESGNVVLAETATGVTAHPTQAFTLDSTNNWITCNAHGFKVGDVWVPATAGSLSGTGLTAATRYKIVERDIDWFRVSLRSDGAAITIAGAGTGSHSGHIVGSVQYDFASATVDEAGQFRGWFTITSGSETHHFPSDEYGLPIEIKGIGN